MNKKKKVRHFSSNAIRLSGRELLIAGAITFLGLMIAVPWLWQKKETVTLDKDFRLAYNYRDDYWTFKKCADEVCRKYPVVFLGDSVIWGMYVDNNHTIPAWLNQKLGTEAAGNLAIDGMHYVAMEGLLKYYGSAIHNKKVFLYFNPLWLNSSKFDLSDNAAMDIHHPRLLPQFSPALKCYREPLSKRMSVLMERNLPFYSLLNHLRLTFFDNEDFNRWIIEHPEESPLTKISFSVDPCEHNHNDSSMTWKMSGITAQDWNWVPLDESKQWAAFNNVLELLKSRNNQVFVLVGSINPFILTKNSLDKYNQLRADICAGLKKENTPFFLLPELPSGSYADASHPLSCGYEQIAATLLQSPDFVKYINQGDGK
ncbi:MAG: hypothetical protein WC071_09050 [Victivallaceae bacterium]